MKFAEWYKYNEDGSVRVEFVTKEHGAIPLSIAAKMFRVDVKNTLACDKSKFREMLFGIKHINDDGIACDEYCNPLEDEETYAPLPGKEIEKWDQHIFISRDGESALDDEEWSKLSPDQQSTYRKVDCMEVKFSTDVPLNGPVYLCKEAVEIMEELFGLDVLIGDPINKRYQYECRHNTAFAAQYGYVLSLALRELERQRFERNMAHLIGGEIIGMLSEIFDHGDGGSKPNESEEADDDQDEDRAGDSEGPKETE